MHTHTIRTKYTFGDRVNFLSRVNGSGAGTINGIGFDENGHYYMIDVDGESHTQGGIEEEEITPATCDTPS